MIVRRLLNSSYYFAGKWIGDGGNDESDGACPACDQAASNCAGPVARLFRNFPDSLGGLGIHQRTVLQRTGDGGVRYPGEARNVLDGWLAKTSLRGVIARSSISFFLFKHGALSLIPACDVDSVCISAQSQVNGPQSVNQGFPLWTAFASRGESFHERERRTIAMNVAANTARRAVFQP